MNAESRKTLAARTVEELKKLYPDAVCSLTYKNPVQLLIAVRLSAQCTDARVNLVTPVLFEKYPTLEALCEATDGDIGEIIKPCGLFNTKARDIRQSALMIRDEFGGNVPDSMEQLLRLPGVGRKTANLILGDVYGKPAIVPLHPHCRKNRTDRRHEGPREGGKTPSRMCRAGRGKRSLPPLCAVRAGDLHGAFSPVRRLSAALLLRRVSGETEQSLTKTTNKVLLKWQ